MKKLFLGLLLVSSVTIAFAQTAQTGSTTETKQKTTKAVHKKTTSTNSNDGVDVKISATKKHNGMTKGKHKGAAVKQTKTTTTTTTTPQ